MKRKLCAISCIFLLLSGCSEKPKVSTFHAEEDRQEIETLEKALTDNKKIVEAAGVFFDHQLVVSLQVKPLSKFKKEKITKSLEKEVKSLFPDHDVFVSSDLKITWELNKVIEKQSEGKELKKDLDEIQELAKEET